MTKSKANISQLAGSAVQPAPVKQRPYRPLKRGPKDLIEFDNEDTEAYRYDFFIPAAIWRHSATQVFLAALEQIEPNYTVFKGALGAYKEDVEDVHIYVMILKKGDWNPDDVRTGLRDAIADLMARLAEWRESIQKAFLFTETVIRMNLTTIVDVDRALAKFDEEEIIETTARKAKAPSKKAR
jgi:hypothetical protein